MSLDAGRVGVRADQVDVHGRVTSPSFLNELLEDLPEWTDMPVWVNGTEELLPSNNSVPVTSPILADIAYPDIRRDNQYFTYRESPTPVDGLAKIKSIKGNTLVWNQLVQNGNFVSSSGWGINGGTLAVANNTATLTANVSVAYVQIYRDEFKLNTSHKYLIRFNYNATNITNFLRAIVNSTDGSTYVQLGQNTSNSGTFNVIVTPSLSATRLMFAFVTNGNANGSGTISNVQLFDLTKMGLDISSPSDFTSLFPLPYYDYNQGSLLSFMGNGIKTVGFNQWDEEWEVGAYNSADGSKVNISDRIRNKNPIRIFPSVAYYRTKGLQVYYYDANMNYLGWNTLDNLDVFTPPSNACYMNFNGLANSGTTYNNDICINISSSRNGEYVPYTSSTLSLPISTYFPTGMKSAEDVYDELTPTRGIIRVGKDDVPISSSNWQVHSSGRFYLDGWLPDGIASNRNANITNNRGLAMQDLMGEYGSYMWLGAAGLYINKISSTETIAEMQARLNGLTLNYELATPVELPTLSLGE